MLAGCIGALLGHTYLVNSQGVNWIQTPISYLSQDGNWLIHGAVLALFALAQAAMARHVDYRGAGILTRCIQGFSLINAALILSLAYVFTLPDPALHTIMLSVIASITGINMACLIARDIAQHNHRQPAIHGIFLTIWMALIPVYLLVDASGTGAYERAVAVVFCAWLLAAAARQPLTQRT